MNCLSLLTVVALGATCAAAPGHFRPVDPRQAPGVFVWTDTCNVYVVRDGDRALLIDLGDGTVLDHLGEIGVQRVEWVLFTHHHREQCQGAGRLPGTGTQTAGPEAERAFFERPADFRRMAVSLGDPFTIHGASFVRPPASAIHLDRTFQTMDTFAWRGREFRCLDTRGNSPGGMSYLLEVGGKWLAFSGDVMLADARMHTWFDTEWDYGFAAGIQALHNGAAALADFRPVLLLPSHGPAIPNPVVPLRRYQAKLRRLEHLYLRGYEVSTFGAATQDPVSQPTDVPWLGQVSPHLFKFKGPNFWPNFNLILSDTGHALVVDCGLLDEAFLDRALDGLRERHGLRQVDAVIITHMHGDHFLEAPHLREKWGAQIWALDRMGDVCEHPERYAYSAPIQAYGKKGVRGVRFDRLFRSGETLDWEGYHFTVDWMPGQTEFALCAHGRIDGRLVAFTGDNIFGDPSDPTQNGHEAVVAHNSAILDEGYLLAGEYLRRLRPDLLMGGHSFVMERPARFIERYRRWAYDMRAAFRELCPDPEYRYWFDPFWVRAEPYRVSVRAGESASATLHLRGFGPGIQHQRVEAHPPGGLVVEPPTVVADVPGDGRRAFPLTVRAAADAPAGVRIVPLDITLNGRRLGEWFDLIVEVTR